MKRASKHRDQVHPTENFDRARRHLPHRISCGLRVDKEFRSVDGILLLARGCGKWMRPSVYRSVSVEIPTGIRRQGVDLLSSDTPTAARRALFSADLAIVQAEAINLLLSGSVKVLDNVLAASVEDPGLWLADFDDSLNYQSLCDPHLLAEKSGLSVIDSLPARDLAVGGTGLSLDSLANWLWFADRDSKVSTRGRMLVQLDDILQLTYLPPSDGLDAELPAIQSQVSPGLSLMRELMAKIAPKKQYHDPDGKLAVQGMAVPELIQLIQEHFADHLQSSSTLQRELAVRQQTVTDEIAEVICKLDYSVADTLCSLFHLFAAQVGQAVQHFNRRASTCGLPVVAEIILAGRSADSGLLQHLVRGETGIESLTTSEQYGVAPDQLRLANSCMLGLMHIDQLPANVPATTGAEYPRLLGRLTPGRPSNWRRLLTEMADYRPPAMKLREAM